MSDFLTHLAQRVLGQGMLRPRLLARFDAEPSLLETTLEVEANSRRGSSPSMRPPVPPRPDNGIKHASPASTQALAQAAAVNALPSGAPTPYQARPAAASQLVSPTKEAATPFSSSISEQSTRRPPQLSEGDGSVLPPTPGLQKREPLAPPTQNSAPLPLTFAPSVARRQADSLEAEVSNAPAKEIADRASPSAETAKGQLDSASHAQRQPSSASQQMVHDSPAHETAPRLTNSGHRERSYDASADARPPNSTSQKASASIESNSLIASAEQSTPYHHLSNKIDHSREMVLPLHLKNPHSGDVSRELPIQPAVSELLAPPVVLAAKDAETQHRSASGARISSEQEVSAPSIVQTWPLPQRRDSNAASGAPVPRQQSTMGVVAETKDVQPGPRPLSQGSIGSQRGTAAEPIVALPQRVVSQMRRSKSTDPIAHASSTQAPPIVVSIGRLDVRSSPTSPSVARAKSPRSAQRLPTDLSQYLSRRATEGQS